jgi:septum formation protein
MFLNELKRISIVLGSQSPRRSELLAAMDIDFEVKVYPTAEHVDQSLAPETVVAQIAEAKLAAFDKEEPAVLVITADTIVVSPYGEILGKPQSREEAFAVIRSLCCREHLVMTGVAVKYQGNKISFVETTKVRFLELTDAELWYYIDKYSPMDKAGSYGIQEWIGRIAIDKIEGSYENVMGLPTQRLYRELQKIVK